MKAVELNNVWFGVQPHFWQRRREILRGMTFAVEAGSAFGLLGPNGAGKTTTLKAMLGLVRPRAGTVRMWGEPVGRTHVRRRLGFMPEQPYFSAHLTAHELVMQHGLLAGLSRSASARQTQRVLEQVGLSSAAKARLGTFSKGMLQRAGLAQALVADPDLIILDEPMSGLDPIGRRHFRDILVELKTQGKTLLLSTHLLADAETLCDRVAIVVQGEIRHEGDLTSLLSQHPTGIDIHVEAPSPAFAQTLDAGLVLSRSFGTTHIVHAPTLEAANGALDTLRSQRLNVLEMVPLRSSLEEVFLQAIHDGVEP